MSRPDAGTSVLLCLGSNLSPVRHLAAAHRELARRLTLVAGSPVYESVAVGGPPSNPPFLNAAVEVVSERSPADLKYGVLRPIEASLGRVRTGDPDAPRTIDIDIALFGELVVDDRERGIVLPDPEILRRSFIALPLADLAPERRHPVSGETLAEIARRLGGGRGLRRVADDLGALGGEDSPPAPAG